MLLVLSCNLCYLYMLYRSLYRIIRVVRISLLYVSLVFLVLFRITRAYRITRLSISFSVSAFLELSGLSGFFVLLALAA